jgi:hypothetical protein
VDALELHRLATEGTLAALEQAARLWRGDLLEGLSLNEATLETWLMGERERVHELGLCVLAALVDAQIVTGRRSRPSRPESGSWRSTRCANRSIAP